MVRSRLEYCCPLWDPQKVKDIKTLVSVQRTFTRRINGRQHLDYWERLKFLKLKSLQRRRERYIIIYTLKILNNLVPNDINMTFHDTDRLGIKANIPPIVKTSPQYIQTLAENSFPVKAAKLWNIIPKDTRAITVMDTFKSSFGSFLDKVPDKPPTLGYSAPCRNSLIDWDSQSGGLFLA